MYTSDSSKYLPKLSNLMLTFYNNQRHYAVNSGSYMSTLEGVSGVTEFDVTMSNNYYPILSRHSRNGLKTISSSGFYINAVNEIKTAEFFFTPNYLNSDGGLIDTPSGTYTATSYRWNNSGAITKTGISAIYVNGVDKLSLIHS